MHWSLLTVAAPVAVALAVRAVREGHRRRARARAALMAPIPAPVSITHSPALSRQVEQARVLRLTIDTALRTVRSPLLAELPWVRRAYCDEYDRAIVDLRRALWDWLRGFETLPEQDWRRLSDVGLSLRPFRQVLYTGLDRTEDPWDDGLVAAAPDLIRLDGHLASIGMALDRFLEQARACAADGYRALA